jgi:flagellar basal-body rod modification protein FlgD
MTTPLAGVGAPSTAATQSAFATPSSTSSSAATSALALDPQAFLQLLVAQLQNQDPSNPLDTQQMMSQTATLSQVQTMGTMSSTLNELVGMQNAQSAISLIGHQVTYVDSTGKSLHASVTGASLLSSGAQLSLSDGSSVPLSSVIGVGEDTSTSTT